LETYKRLLDEAQIHHVELSKETRLLLAEKEAELRYFKQKYGDKESDLKDNSETNQNDSPASTLGNTRLVTYIFFKLMLIDSFLP
jgi:hypothetical protein